MSGSQNALQNGVQQPLFAPTSQGDQQLLGDDIDLNEIFADYFISEFDDPLNAYTSSMANYSGAAEAVALAQKQQQVEAAATEQAPPPSSSEGLPTGGIKTAFHAAAPAPPPKKLRQEVPIAPSATSAPVAKSGLSDRLGFTMPAAATPAPAAPQPVAPVPVAPQPPAISPKPAPSGGGVPLPVGVGIRLGGVGGVAPATAQLAPTAPPGQFMMWGGMPPGGTGMSEQAIAERRQRNREHAKRSRVRKKFMLESLQEQVKQLQKENVQLRMIVQKKIPQHAQQIISECCLTSPLFADPDDLKKKPADNGKTAEETSLVKADFSLIESLTSGQQNFVLSDPRLPDNPIVYASSGFYELTGYTPDQVLGRNCRFLQGPGTDQRAVDIIRTAIANGADATTCLLNYKADGTPFWNQFFVAALRDSDNCIVNYVGVQCEVDAEAGASFLEDKVNSVLPLQNKDEGGDK